MWCGVTAASSRLLQGASVCAGMWRANGPGLGAAGVRREWLGEGIVPSGKGPARFVSHAYTWPCARCLPVTALKSYHIVFQEENEHVCTFAARHGI